jgi:hypothetical protein
LPTRMRLLDLALPDTWTHPLPLAMLLRIRHTDGRLRLVRTEHSAEYTVGLPASPLDASIVEWLSSGPMRPRHLKIDASAHDLKRPDDVDSAWLWSLQSLVSCTPTVHIRDTRPLPVMHKFPLFLGTKRSSGAHCVLQLDSLSRTQDVSSVLALIGCQKHLPHLTVVMRTWEVLFNVSSTVEQDISALFVRYPFLHSVIFSVATVVRNTLHTIGPVQRRQRNGAPDWSWTDFSADLRDSLASVPIQTWNPPEPSAQTLSRPRVRAKRTKTAVIT